MAGANRGTAGDVGVNPNTGSNQRMSIAGGGAAGVQGGGPPRLRLVRADSPRRLAVKPLGMYRRGVGAPVPKGRREALAGTGFRPRLVNTSRDLAGRATALNQNSGLWRVTPSSTAIEVQTLAWIAEMLGFPSSATW